MHQMRHEQEESPRKVQLLASKQAIKQQQQKGGAGEEDEVKQCVQSKVCAAKVHDQMRPPTT